MALTIADREAEYRVLRYVTEHDGRKTCADAVEAVCLTGVERRTAERALWHLLDMGRVRLDATLALALGVTRTADDHD